MNAFTFPRAALYGAAAPDSCGTAPGPQDRPDDDPLRWSSLMDAWQLSDSIALPEDVLQSFHEATEGIQGLICTPVAYLGRQVVAGSIHCLLCRSVSASPDAQPYYALVHVYQKLGGGARLLGIQRLSLGISGEEE